MTVNDACWCLLERLVVTKKCPCPVFATIPSTIVESWLQNHHILLGNSSKPSHEWFSIATSIYQSVFTIINHSKPLPVKSYGQFSIAKRFCVARSLTFRNYWDRVFCWMWGKLRWGLWRWQLAPVAIKQLRDLMRVWMGKYVFIVGQYSDPVSQRLLYNDIILN